MLRTGSVILSLWAALNLVPSLFILINTGFLGGHAPAVYQLFTDSDLTKLDPDIIASLNSVALFANGLNVAFAIMVLSTVWRALNNRATWAFWALLVASIAAIVGGVLGDIAVGTQHPEINLVSALMLLCGFTLCALSLFRSGAHSSGR